jgi:uncharacterized protein YnzC (UPF0291/DUF896 family)
MIKRNPNLDMKMQATRMAMQGLGQRNESQQMSPEGDEVKAPVVPTTNTNLPQKPKMTQPARPLQPKPMAVSGASGIPQGAGAAPPKMMTGFASIPVTGSGNRATLPESVGGGPNPGYDPDIANRIANENQQRIRNELAGIPGWGGKDSQSSLMDQAINDLLTGNVQGRDTTAEEAAIRDEIARSASANQAELMARMGAGGGGTSGAMSALTGDLQIKAANEAINRINELRSQARGERLDELETGISARNKAVEIANQEKLRQAYLDMIQSIYGEDGGGEGGGGGGGGLGAADKNNDGELSLEEQQNFINSFYGFNLISERQPSTSSTSSSGTGGGGKYMLGSKGAVPENATLDRTEGSYDIYTTPDGNEYWVPAGS